MIKPENDMIKQHLYRIIHNDSGAQIFTVTPTHDILPTVNFPEFKQAYTRSNKFDKSSTSIAKLISTESSLWFLCAKILPGLNLHL